MWRRKLLLKAKGLEADQGRREDFVPNPEISLGVHTTAILQKSLKRPYSVSSLCEILLASVDDLFHPGGPIEPQSVKYRYGRQKGPCMGAGVLAGMPMPFPSRLEIVTRTSAFLCCPGIVQTSLEK